MAHGNALRIDLDARLGLLRGSRDLHCCLRLMVLDCARLRNRAAADHVPFVAALAQSLAVAVLAPHVHCWVDRVDCCVFK